MRVCSSVLSRCCCFCCCFFSLFFSCVFGESCFFVVFFFVIFLLWWHGDRWRRVVVEPWASDDPVNVRFIKKKERKSSLFSAQSLELLTDGGRWCQTNNVLDSSSYILHPLDGRCYRSVFPKLIFWEPIF